MQLSPEAAFLAYSKLRHNNEINLFLVDVAECAKRVLEVTAQKDYLWLTLNVCKLPKKIWKREQLVLDVTLTVMTASSKYPETTKLVRE